MCPRTLLVVAAFGLFGCGKIREIRQCRALAALVNPALDEISSRVGKEQNAAAYRFASTRYAKLSGDLQHFHLGIPRAEGTVEELAGAMKDASSNAAKLAEALDKSDAVVAGNARRDLGHLARQQKSITMRLASECSE